MLKHSAISNISEDGVNRSLPWLKRTDLKWNDADRENSVNISKRLLSYSHYANHFEDINSVIEMMLTEARDATRADGGMFYLVTDDRRLRFTYFQNGKLFNGRSEPRNHYVKASIPIDDSSISGHVAKTQKIINIPNVEKIPSDGPYRFNTVFDTTTGYNTVSVLTVPVIGGGEEVLAVIQLMNRMSPLGFPVAFDSVDEMYVELLAMQTTPYLTKSIMTRRLLDTMLRISEMRDPFETGGHVQRVGAFAAEIYHEWASRHGIDFEQIMKDKDTIRLAAMLHDIGKVAIPDVILKKPGRLTADEYEIIKTHCAMGAAMYERPRSSMERSAYEITLYHHQRWDGKGYTGDEKFPNLEGEEIPIFARITSVADVLDALSFSRSYKPAWSFSSVMDELKRSAGTQFDPEVVEAALDIADTLKAIIARYQ